MLWGNKDYATSNNKPLWANTTNASSNSVINSTKANTNKYYGIVAGVSATEQTTLQGTASIPHPQHAGWVSLKVGTGPIKAISASGGSGINAAGYLTITDASALGNGSAANISFTIANSQNSLQSYSTNSAWNTISTLTIVNGGAGYSNVSALTIRTNGSNTSLPSFTVELGGRGGRYSAETLIAMGSITFDDPRDNVWFSGI
jgi:hypothetical protein